jgi:hypothetical protein
MLRICKLMEAENYSGALFSFSNILVRRIIYGSMAFADIII